MTGELRGYGPGSREYRRILVALAVAGVATFAQIYSPQGILPLVASDLRVSAADTALLISATTIGLAAGVLPWSFVADRLGRLPVMRISMVGACLLGLAAPFWPGFDGVLVLRLLEGIALGGLPATAITYIHEEISPYHAAIAAGTFVSGTTIGGLAGRLMAAPIAEVFGWRVGIAAVAVVCALATAVFVLVAPRARGFTRRSSSGNGRFLPAIVSNLRDRGVLTLLAQAFLLMGAFVAVYNFLGFRLEAPPFDLPTTMAALIFVAYLAGTVSARVAGGAAQRLGRARVLLTGIAGMVAGVVLTLTPWLPVILIGLVVLTASFFGAHAVASGWIGHIAPAGRAQAPALYNLFYYAGSSLFGWGGGLAFASFGWTGTATMVMLLCLAAAAIAAAYARRVQV